MSMSAIAVRFIHPLLVSVALLLAAPAIVFALDVPPAPADVPIVDQTNTLTAEQKTELAGMIARERSSSGNQIGVLMIRSLEDEALEEYSIKVAREWGIGTKERDNGVLLLIAKDDRRVRIEVGYGLEGALPDIRSGQIIRERIAPEFRAGRYFEGIRSGLEGITAAIHNEADPALNAKDTSFDGSLWEGIIYAFFMLPVGIMWLAAILARTKSWWAGGVLGLVIGLIITIFAGFLFVGLMSIIGLAIAGLLFDKAVSGNFRKSIMEGGHPSWWAGGTHLGGGGGSGGFGGFGGGGFGGGGASGDW